jgi:hypothetical protein
MQRRDFLTFLGGAAAAWPLAARAQQPPVPTIGYLYAGPPTANVEASFRKGLSEMGFVDDRNVAIEFRYAGDQNERLPLLAAELVRRQVAVIFANGGALAVPAAQAASTTIPIVFVTGADPVRTGMVTSFNRPGGNVTGISSMTTELTAKRLGLLHALLPAATRFAVLVNPSVPGTAASVTAYAQETALIFSAARRHHGRWRRGRSSRRCKSSNFEREAVPLENAAALAELGRRGVPVAARTYPAPAHSLRRKPEWRRTPMGRLIPSRMTLTTRICPAHPVPLLARMRGLPRPGRGAHSGRPSPERAARRAAHTGFSWRATGGETNFPPAAFSAAHLATARS